MVPEDGKHHALIVRRKVKEAVPSDKPAISSVHFQRAHVYRFRHLAGQVRPEQGNHLW